MKAREYLAFAEHLGGTIAQRTTDLKANKIVAESSLELKQSGKDLALLRREYTNADLYGGDVRSFVLAKNSKYSFRLERSKGSAGWAIGQAVLNPRITKGHPLEDIVGSLTTWLAPHYELNEPLTELVMEPGFVVRESTRVTAGGASYLRITFAYRAQKQKEQWRNCEGWILLDPENGWCIKEAEFKHNSAQAAYTTTVLNDYRTHTSGFALPRRHVVRRAVQIGKEQKAYEDVLALEVEPHDGVAEREFTLTAFGLPEMQGVVWDKPLPYHLWLVGGAAVVLFVAWLLRHLARRRAAVAS